MKAYWGGTFVVGMLGDDKLSKAGQIMTQIFYFTYSPEGNAETMLAIINRREHYNV
jgi:hypothetical protein